MSGAQGVKPQAKLSSASSLLRKTEVPPLLNGGSPKIREAFLGVPIIGL